MRKRSEFAHLFEKSPFFPIFEHGAAPILNILISSKAKLEGLGEQEVYWLDVERCTEEQIRKICEVACEVSCGGQPDEFYAAIKAGVKVPLRAIHVQAISSRSMAFL